MARRSKFTAAQEEPERERITVSIPLSTAERARDAVYWTPGATVATLVTEALEREISRLETKRGEPFPPRTGNIRTGRPVKT